MIIDLLQFVVLTKQIELNQTLLGSIILAIIAVGALCATIYSIHSQQKHSKFERLIEVYEMVNDPKQREARKHIFSAYNIYHKNYYPNKEWNGKGLTYPCKYINIGHEYEDVFNDPEVLNELGLTGFKIKEDVEMVRATLDHIGSLLVYNLIPQQSLLESMWGTVRVCWICLKDNIMIERDKRKTKFYMNHFESFFNKIEVYRKKHKPPLPPVEPY